MATGNRWRFASKRVDPETGLVCFGRRYYDLTLPLSLVQAKIEVPVIISCRSEQRQLADSAGILPLKIMAMFPLSIGPC